MQIPTIIYLYLVSMDGLEEIFDSSTFNATETISFIIGYTFSRLPQSYSSGQQKNKQTQFHANQSAYWQSDTHFFP